MPPWLAACVHGREGSGRQATVQRMGVGRTRFELPPECQPDADGGWSSTNAQFVAFGASLEDAAVPRRGAAGVDRSQQVRVGGSHVETRAIDGTVQVGRHVLTVGRPVSHGALTPSIVFPLTELPDHYAVARILGSYREGEGPGFHLEYGRVDRAPHGFELAELDFSCGLVSITVSTNSRDPATHVPEDAVEFPGPEDLRGAAWTSTSSGNSVTRLWQREPREPAPLDPVIFISVSPSRDHDPAAAEAVDRVFETMLRTLTVSR